MEKQEEEEMKEQEEEQREIERERERDRKRTGKRKKKRKTFNKRPDSFWKGLGFELFNCFCKRLFFLLLVPGSALEKLAAIFVNLENKPTKVNWTLSWPSGPSALEICGTTALE